MKRDYEAEVRYDREALLYDGDAWKLASQHKISWKEYNDFHYFIVHNSDMDAMIAEYEKLLTLANSRGDNDVK